MSSLNCPLCESPEIKFVSKGHRSRSYFGCRSCDLVFADPMSLLSKSEEKSRYSAHNNDLAQEGYRNFLDQMWIPLREKLNSRKGRLGEDKSALEGLDFGCGPSQAFSQLAGEGGFSVQGYDPYFFNNQNLLNREYDFIWCSEVFEHFNEPKKMLSPLDQLLKPGGILAVMTGDCPSWEDFEKWWYHNDETHVSFYSFQTMKWLAQFWGYRLERPHSRVTFFEKSRL